MIYKAEREQQNNKNKQQRRYQKKKDRRDINSESLDLVCFYQSSTPLSVAFKFNDGESNLKAKNQIINSIYKGLS